MTLFGITLICLAQRLKHRKPISRDSVKHYRHVHDLPPVFAEDDDSANDSTDSPRFTFKAIKQDSQDLQSENSDGSRSETPNQLNASDDVKEGVGRRIESVCAASDNSKRSDGVEKDDRDETEGGNETVAETDSDATKDSNGHVDNGEEKKTDDSTGKDPASSESQLNLSEQENKPDNQTVLRLLEEGEKIRCFELL